MTTPVLQISVTHDLVCPICQAPGECETHCVEVWQEGHRPEHFIQLLQEYPQEWDRGEILYQKYATPEQCFEHCILLCRTEGEPAGHQPLFSGKALVHSSRPLRWMALYHPEGPRLLERYRKSVRCQLEKTGKLQGLLRTLRNSNVPDISEKPPSNSNPESLVDESAQNVY